MVDKEHFAIYLIDVSGHGVGAALLSISVINVLRSQSLTKTDFKDPGQVLRSLNLTFPSESNKDKGKNAKFRPHVLSYLY